MSLSGLTRSLRLGSGFVQLDSLLFAVKFSALQRRLLAMDDMSRFQYAVLASVVLHAAVMFGIGIRPPDMSKLDFVAPPLEVVLVNAKTANRPLQADALAQRNLDGGGNTDAARRRAKSPLPVTRRDRQTSEPARESQRLQQLEREAQRLLTQVKSQAAVESAATQPQPQTETKVAAPSVADIMTKSIQIARLEAQIDKDMDSYQKRPRRHFVGARTQEYRFARYIEDWRLKVERIGTLNYPQAAREQKIYGKLKLTVSIRADGTVENVEINQSSGQKILDEAALRIVRLGAPYSAFPPSISRDYDVLSITRTWEFTRSDRFTPD